MRHDHRAAFSLTESLVVLALVAALIAVLILSIAAAPLPFQLLPPFHATMMTDFQGCSGPARVVTVRQFQPLRMGMDGLNTDGSVDFGYANLGGG